MLSRLSLCPDHFRQHGFERRLRGAVEVAKLLRHRVTLPAELEQEGNWQSSAVLLPRVSCAFRVCTGLKELDEARASEVPGVSFEDRTLREHILAKHKQAIMNAAGVEDDADLIYDTYREALAVQERNNVQAVGPCVDRRAFEATLDVYNDKNIQALICMCCARICLQTAGPRSSIEYKKGIWFLKLPAGPLQVRW